MTSSGYLSSSREGKLPETKIRKFAVDSDANEFHPAAEKKLNMKKVLEGIKKTEEKQETVKIQRQILPSAEAGPSSDELPAVPVAAIQPEREEKEEAKEKEVAVVEKSKEKEKEKLKKKNRVKEKLLEEFAFFETPSAASAASASAVSSTKIESASPSVPDSAASSSSKQKLSVFKKFSNKSRDPPESLSPRSLTPSRPLCDSLDRIHHNPPSSGIVAPEGTSGRGGIESKTESEQSDPGGKQKSSRKEKKIKNRKHPAGDPLPELEIPAGTVEFHEESRRKSAKIGFDPPPEVLESNIASHKGNKRKMAANASASPSAGNPADGEPHKRKRGRPSTRMPTPEVAAGREESIRNYSPTDHPHPPDASALHPMLPKPFFPFASARFAAPGLIPAPFMPPNVPFNLLGVPPIGLRSPLGIPPSGLMAMPPALPEKTQKSPNIVDSLTGSSQDVPLPPPPPPPPESHPADEDSTANVKRKEKKEKKEKEKKKKDKKLKDKTHGGDDAERKAKRDKKKEKKDKEKEKEKSFDFGSKRDKEENVTVPKITFKFSGTASASPTPTIVESVGPKL